MAKQGHKHKREHYVAQSYLESFTKDGDILFVFDKVSQKVFPKNKREVAQEKYFYDIPEEMIPQEFVDIGIHPQIIEDALASIDSKFKRAVNDLLNIPPDGSIKIELKHALCFLLAVQLLRTRDTRNLLLETKKKFYEAICRDLVEMNSPGQGHLAPKVEITNEPVAHNQILFNPEFWIDIAKIFNAHTWLLGINETGHPLYTSDTPLVKKHYIDHPYCTGWASPGVDISFPLSPRRVLIIREKTFFPEYAPYDRQVCPLNIKDVEHFNKLQVIHSHRQIFSQADSFDIAEQLCKERPELCSPISDRAEVNFYDKADEPGDAPTAIRRNIELLIKAKK